MKLVWDTDGKRFYEMGVDRGVVYPYLNGRYQPGGVWNGLITVTENPSGGEPTKVYADNGVYIVITSAEEYALGIESYTRPKELNASLGRNQIALGAYILQQNRPYFGFCYRSGIGNDRDGVDHSYQLHLIFKCFASASESSHATTNNDPDAEQYSFDITTLPVSIGEEYKASEITLDARQFKDAGLMNVLHAIEDRLYGTSVSDPEFITPSGILEIFTEQRFIRDSSSNMILDSFGNSIESRVFN